MMGFRKSNSSRYTILATSISVALHCALWSIFVMMMYSLVPKYQKIHDDYGKELPRSTVLVIDASYFVVEYFFLIPFLLIPLLVLDGIIDHRLRQPPRPIFLARLWSLLMSFIPVVLAICSFIAIIHPLYAVP